MLYYIIAALVVGIDQLTKWLVVTYMQLGESIEVIPNFFNLTSHRNRGAAWGMLEGKMYFFYAITLVFVVGIVYYIQKFAKQERLFGIALAFLLGGAIGNFIDRLINQEVVDFFHFNFGDYHFPVFNVADMSLTFGVILVFLHIVLEERKTKKEKFNE